MNISEPWYDCRCLRDGLDNSFHIEGAWGIIRVSAGSEDSIRGCLRLVG